MDESGCHTSMHRQRAWARRGQRARGVVPRNRGRVLTMIGALAVDGIKALMLVRGGTTAIVFRRFVHEHLAPQLHKGDLVVLDNLAAHHAGGVREAVEARGATLVFQPPYSPDLNPIELAWSKVKTLVRATAARTVPRLSSAIRRACRAISTSDAAAWFRHCGVGQRR